MTWIVTLSDESNSLPTQFVCQTIDELNEVLQSSDWFNFKITVKEVPQDQ